MPPIQVPPLGYLESRNLGLRTPPAGQLQNMGWYRVGRCLGARAINLAIVHEKGGTPQDLPSPILGLPRELDGTSSMAPSIG